MTTTTISHLPNELLIEVAQWTLQRHDSEHYVTSSSDLAAFSSTSSLFRALALPILFREIVIVNEQQLTSLSHLDAELLAFTQQFSIFLDSDLFESFKFWGFVRRRTGPPGGVSPYDAVARVLSRTPNLNTLRIQLAQLTGPQSAWTRLFHESPFAIPLSDALSRSNIPFSLPNLHTLELDGFSAIDRLLKASPNLDSLRLRLSGGYSEHANSQLVTALRHVPQLRELVYTPSTLRLEKDAGVAEVHGHWNFQNADTDVAAADEEEGTPLSAEDLTARVELIQQIGTKLPLLQHLDLVARSCDEGISFSAPLEIIPSTTLIDALSSFNHLQHFALSNTVLPPSVIDMREGKQVLRAMRVALRPETSSPSSGASSSPDITSTRLAALEAAARTEREVAQALLKRQGTSTSATALKSISFVRPVVLAESYSGQGQAVLSAVQYHNNQSSSSREVVTLTSQSASAGQFDPLSSDRHWRYGKHSAGSSLAQRFGSIRKAMRTHLCNTIESTTNSLRYATSKSSSTNDDEEDDELARTNKAAASVINALKPWVRCEADLEAAMSTASVALATLGGCMIGDAMVRELVLGGQDAAAAGSGMGVAASVLKYMGPPLMGGVVGGAMLALPSGR